jgi:peptidoglycan/xylan/chitin deacetylase (PgdA/CDA1 family)
VRRYLKLAVEAALTHSPLLRLGDRRMRGRTLILAYHNIVADGSHPVGDRSLHLPLADFSAQLDLLERHCQVVGLEDALVPGGDRPRVAITFDDAYRGAVRLAVPELARRGLPATVFVCPGRLGGWTFWWDLLATAREGLPPSVRRHVLETLQGRDEPAQEWARQQRLEMTTPQEDYRTATEEDLQAAVRYTGLRLGSHGWSHAALPSLDQAALALEVGRPLEWLRSRFAATLPWLSYPYGLSSSAVAHAAKQAGYQAACMVSGGWLPTVIPNRFALPRLNLPCGLSANGFRLRTAGLFSQ